MWVVYRESKRFREEPELVFATDDSAELGRALTRFKREDHFLYYYILDAVENPEIKNEYVVYVVREETPLGANYAIMGSDKTQKSYNIEDFEHLPYKDEKLEGADMWKHKDSTSYMFCFQTTLDTSDGDIRKEAERLYSVNILGR